MINKNQKFFFENNEITKIFSDFKKLKLLGDENKKEREEKINKSEKLSTSEEEINNLEEKLNKIIINKDEENQNKEKSKIINEGNLNVKSMKNLIKKK